MQSSGFFLLIFLRRENPVISWIDRETSFDRLRAAIFYCKLITPYSVFFIKLFSLLLHQQSKFVIKAYIILASSESKVTISHLLRNFTTNRLCKIIIKVLVWYLIEHRKAGFPPAKEKQGGKEHVASQLHAHPIVVPTRNASG